MRSPALERRVPRLQPVHRSAAHVLRVDPLRRPAPAKDGFGIRRKECGVACVTSGKRAEVLFGGGIGPACIHFRNFLLKLQHK